MSRYKPSMCQSCGFSYLRFSEIPCRDCQGGDQWVSKVSKIHDSHMVKPCDDCRHSEVEADDEPCCHCVGSGSEFVHKLSGTKADLVIVDEIEDPQEDTQEAEIGDPINHPSHYGQSPVEAIRIIELALTEAFGEIGYQAYCFGNELKYRLRAGFKGPADEDIGKALKYQDFRRGGGND